MRSKIQKGQCQVMLVHKTHNLKQNHVHEKFESQKLNADKLYISATYSQVLEYFVFFETKA